VFTVPAEFYDRFIGRYSPSLAEELIPFAAIEAPLRVLDVGCGSGLLTNALFDRGFTVTACDPSDTFVAATRKRVPRAEVVQATAEELPFADGSFDAALAQLVVNFMRDAEAGVRQMARVTEPGGTIAACVWDYGGEMTLLRTFWEAACVVDPDVVGESELMHWRQEGQLGELWETAGLTGVRSGAIEARASYAGFEDLWAPLPAGTGPAGAFTAALDEVKQQALHDELKRRLEVGDKPFELTARAWAAAGTVA
jgi:SAM-dependent methyltransferase